MHFPSLSVLVPAAFLLSSIAGAVAIEASPAIEERQTGTTGYHYMACLGTQGSPFTKIIAGAEYPPPLLLNPECAALCRSYNTQYYAVIDYPSQCSCGNDIQNLDYYDGDACLPCGDEKAKDEGYSTGPGMCGDYYNGGAAVYSLDF